MKTKDGNPNLFRQKAVIEEGNSIQGYPLYPEEEDIYNKFKKEKNIDPEVISKIKEPVVKIGENNVKDFNEDESGSDLDIPGPELDGDSEDIGIEDEENSYYSIGGDDHDELEEDK